MQKMRVDGSPNMHLQILLSKYDEIKQDEESLRVK